MDDNLKQLLSTLVDWLDFSSSSFSAMAMYLEGYVGDDTQPEPTPEPTPIPEPIPEPVEPPVEPPVQPPVEPPARMLSYFEWTYAPDPSTNIIYVSSSTGRDSFDGLSPSTPVKTIAKGLSLLRDGKPDWLLFKRGDTWVGETFGNFRLSGLASSKRMILASYGDKNAPRPVFDTLDKSGLNTFDKGSNPLEKVSHVAFVGLHFIASRRKPGSANFSSSSNPTGFRFLRGTDDLVIDDCKFEYYHNNITIQSYAGTILKNVRIENTVVLNAYAHSPNNGHSQGLYAAGVDGLSITDCIFDNNGHNNEAPHSEPTIFNHNIYVQKSCTNVNVARCVISRASSHGLQIRPGGGVHGNFFWENPINLLVGYEALHLDADVQRNVIAGGTNISDKLPRVWGIEFKNKNPTGVTIRNNIVVNSHHVSPNSRSIENRSNVQYSGNVVHNWAPIGAFDDLDADYLNPNVSVDGAKLYQKMRLHSKDNPQVDVMEYLNKYTEAFKKV